MGLIINFERDSCVPIKFYGGTVLSDQINSQKIEVDHFAQYGEAISTLTAVPNGYYPPTCWRLPIKAGNMISKNKILGIGSIVTANANMGFDLSATLTGQGEFYQAIGALVADLVATLVGSGGISNAELEGIVEGMAILTGSGDIDGIIEAIADLSAIVTGQGTIVADLEAVGDMAATIKGYGDLSVEGLRDAIWTAVASKYVDLTTMGGLLNTAGSGGLSPEQVDMLQEIHKILGLKVGSPVNITKTGQSVDDITLTFEGDGENDLTITRE